MKVLKRTWISSISVEIVVGIVNETSTEAVHANIILHTHEPCFRGNILIVRGI